MGLETGTGIGDLVPTNPLSTDAVSAGDDHIRLIKTVMQSITFFKSIQTFAVNFTWTRPANVKKILVYCIGGGAGGGGGKTAQYSGGGGSGGGSAIKFLDVSAIASATVTIGAGGTAGAAGGGFGGNGGDTSFVTAGPVTQCLGKGGVAESSSYEAGGLAPSIGSNVGDIVFVGGDGANGIAVDAGSSLYALGGKGGGNGGARGGASAQTVSGGGGGGGIANSAGQFIAGSGGSGYCVVFEFGW